MISLLLPLPGDQQLLHKLLHVDFQVLSKLELQYLSHLILMYLGVLLIVLPAVAEPQLDGADVHGEEDLLLNVVLIHHDSLVVIWL